jgi:glycosyltransferase involved in cell wall biosynthesis
MHAVPPRFAILLCTHNGAAFLGPQLRSLAEQALPATVLFVHDWGSRDSTREIVAHFAAEQTGRLPVELIRHDETPGAARSFVAGLRHCITSPFGFDYVALCDQDDVWDAEKLARYAAAIGVAALPPALVYSDARLIDERGQVTAASLYGHSASFREPHDLHDPALLLANPVVGMTLCISRPCLAACAAELDGPWLMHDWALLLLGLSRGHRALYIASALAGYRQHRANALGAAHGWRFTHRLGKAARHFARIREQAERFGPDAALAFGAAAAGIARPGAAQRWHAVRAALGSSLFAPGRGWLLAAAIAVFW